MLFHPPRVTRLFLGAAGLLVGPRVVLEGRRLELPSVGVLGEPAHGIFTVLPGDGGPEELVVARLESLLTRELRQLVVDARPLVVPAQDEPRFLHDFVPELRQKVGLSSSDHEAVTILEAPDSAGNAAVKEGNPLRSKCFAVLLIGAEFGVTAVYDEVTLG